MRRIPVVLLALSVACEHSNATVQPPITVFAAASLARPLASVSREFEQRRGIPVLAELGGSLELSRRMTDLSRHPDVAMLVGDDVIAALVPREFDWYVRFGTNHLVIAYTPRSAHADSITTENWWRMLARPDVRVGRADPLLAPAGRHAITVLRRAESYYHEPDLSSRLLARSPRRLVRPDASEIAALLEAGEVDYILDYESVARQFGFSFTRLPEDLAPAVLYGVSVPRAAAHQEQGIAFAAFLLSDEGKRLLRDADVDALAVPVAVGRNVPPEISDRVRSLTAAAATP